MPEIDRPAANTALQDMREAGVALLGDGCVKRETAFKFGSKFLFDESAASGKAWLLVVRDHLAAHSIETTMVQQPQICAANEFGYHWGVVKSQSRLDQQVAEKRPVLADPSIVPESGLDRALQRLACQRQARIQALMPREGIVAPSNFRCEQQLTPADSAALSEYAGGSRYLLVTGNYAPVWTTGNKLFSGIMTFGLDLLTGPPGTAAGSQADSLQNLQRLAQEFDDAYLNTSTVNERTLLGFYGVLYDVQQSRFLWLAHASNRHHLPRAQGCGSRSAKSRTANDLFASLLCQ